jgi:hypothetical protein
MRHAGHSEPGVWLFKKLFFVFSRRTTQNFISMGIAAKPVDNGFMPVFKIKAILNTQRFIQFDSFCVDQL